MKKNIKQLIKGAIIFFTTLIIGFGITAISFNLFDYLTDNQMKLLFAIDIVILLAIGCVFYVYSEKKKAKRKKEFEARYNKRVSKQCKEYRDFEYITDFNNLVA